MHKVRHGINFNPSHILGKDFKNLSIDLLGKDCIALYESRDKIHLLDNNFQPYNIPPLTSSQQFNSCADNGTVLINDTENKAQTLYHKNGLVRAKTDRYANEIQLFEKGDFLTAYRSRNNNCRPIKLFAANGYPLKNDPRKERTAWKKSIVLSDGTIVSSYKSNHLNYYEVRVYHGSMNKKFEQFYGPLETVQINNNVVAKINGHVFPKMLVFGTNNLNLKSLFELGRCVIKNEEITTPFTKDAAELMKKTYTEHASSFYAKSGYKDTVLFLEKDSFRPHFLTYRDENFTEQLNDFKKYVTSANLTHDDRPYIATQAKLLLHAYNINSHINMLETARELTFHDDGRNLYDFYKETNNAKNGDFNSVEKTYRNLPHALNGELFPDPLADYGEFKENLVLEIEKRLKKERRNSL